MSKLTYEDKINLYKDRKNGLTISKLVSKYNILNRSIRKLLFDAYSSILVIE